jgi:hypothetical protein
LRKRIAQRQHRRRTCSRGKIEPARFTFHAAIQDHIARLRQRGLQIAAEAHQRIALAFQRREEP